MIRDGAKCGVYPSGPIHTPGETEAEAGRSRDISSLESKDETTGSHRTDSLQQTSEKEPLSCTLQKGGLLTTQIGNCCLHAAGGLLEDILWNLQGRGDPV